MNSPKYLYISFLALLFSAGCKEEEKNVDSIQNVTTTIQLTEKQWNYLNLESGVIVGTSSLGDKTADEQWKNRTDWDIAFCDDMIRTNGGTSGTGQGAIQVIDQPFDVIEEAPANGYVTDQDNVEIW